MFKEFESAKEAKNAVGDTGERLMTITEKISLSLGKVVNFLEKNHTQVAKTSEETLKVLRYAPFVGMAFSFLLPIVKSISVNSRVSTGAEAKITK